MGKVKDRLRSICKDDETTPLPKTTIAILFSLMFFNGMKLTMVYAYLPRLVQWFGVPEVDVGKYAGMIASSAFVGRIIMSFVWGYIADVKGKKFAVVMSSCGLAITSLAFGFSYNLYWALVTRFMQGCLTDFIPICKAILKDNCDDSNFPLGMSILLSSISIGLLIGPSLSGFVSFPAQQYPSVFSEDSILGRFPALLPNLVIVVGLFISITVAIIFLPKDKRKEEDYLSVVDSPTHHDKKLKLSLKDRILDFRIVQVLRQKWCVAVSALFCTFAMVATGISEIFIVFASTSIKYNGIGFTPRDIGIIMLSVAAVLFVVQITILSRLTKKHGSKHMFIWSAVTFAICVPLAPCIAKIQDYTVMWVSLILYLLICRVAISQAFLAMNIMLSNSVDSSMLGLANGFSVSCSSIGRAIAPASLGSIFSWSLTNIKGIEGNENALGFPFNQFLTFFILSFIAVLSAVVATFIPEHLNKVSWEKSKATNDSK